MMRRNALVLGALTLGLLACHAPAALAQSVAPPEPRGFGANELRPVSPLPDPQVTPARYGEPAPVPSGPLPGSGTNQRAGRYQAAGQALTESAATPRPQSPVRSTAPITPIGRSSNNRSNGGQDLAPVGAPRVNRAKVTKGSGSLPNDAGQVWRDYEIRPYTARIANEPKPQQRIVDWILRETGYEAWHGETVGILSANRETLSVYHTPAMQAIVADIVDRFVNGRAAERAFSMRILTVRNPDWRVKALRLMTPISVQSPGLQGWIMPKENHALLLSELARRSDVRDYNAAGQLVPNGQAIVFSTMRPRGYVKGIIPTQQAWPGYQPETGQLDEGASLEFNPLLSMNLDTAEAVIKLRMAQVEKMRRVSLDLPAPAVAGGSTGGQRLQIEVPQVTMANLHERFRWPADQVLLLSMGMVATPGPESGGAFSDMLPDMMKSPPRADALLFVQARNSQTPTAGPTAQRAGNGGRISTAVRPTPTFSGRY